jgi:quercetin dioxygenase-like cupin family protein
MKNTVFLNSVLLLLALTFLNGCRTDKKKDQQTEAETEVAPSVDPVTIFENDYVQVVSVTLDPGEELTSHEGAKRLIYSLSDYTIDWEQGGADLGNKKWKRGEVHAHGPGKHGAKNAGDSKAAWIAFVRKTSDLPDCGDLSLDKDVSSVSGDAAEILFEDADFRVTEITLKPGDSLPMHAGINRVVYALSDYEIRYWSDDSEAAEKTFTKGDAHWHEACQHALENVGETEAKFIVVAYKRMGN